MAEPRKYSTVYILPSVNPHIVVYIFDTAAILSCLIYIYIWSLGSLPEPGQVQEQLFRVQRHKKHSNLV